MGVTSPHGAQLNSSVKVWPNTNVKEKWSPYTVCNLPEANENIRPHLLSSLWLVQLKVLWSVARVKMPSSRPNSHAKLHWVEHTHEAHRHMFALIVTKNLPNNIWKLYWFPCWCQWGYGLPSMIWPCWCYLQCEELLSQANTFFVLWLAPTSVIFTLCAAFRHSAAVQLQRSLRCVLFSVYQTCTNRNAYTLKWATYTPNKHSDFPDGNTLTAPFLPPLSLIFWSSDLMLCMSMLNPAPVLSALAKAQGHKFRHRQ